MSKLDNSFALLIGVGADLPITVRDARAVYNILADETYAGYPMENMILLTEKEASREGILNAFDRLIAKTNEDSSVLLFYSGHGGFYEPWNQFYLVPNGFDEVEYETTWVKAEELRDKIGQLKSRRLVFFMDCCHAAGMTQSLNLTTSSQHLRKPEGLAQKIDDGRGMSIVSSCREDQQSYIMDGDHNSLYTKCLQEVLRAEHKTVFEEPYVRISEVVQYIFRKVPEVNPNQNPYANLQIYDDFIISCVPEGKRVSSVPMPMADQDKNIEKNEVAEVVTHFRQNAGSNSAILFVHGFTGSSEQSFGAIPELLMKQPELEGWDLFPIGYSRQARPENGNDVWASITDIERNADYLATSLKYKFANYDRIAIVAYSLGGLVAQRAILKSAPDEIGRITNLMLFASPNNGLAAKEVEKLWQQKNADLAADRPFIKELRETWNNTFANGFPFELKVVAGTQDDNIPLESNFGPFKEANCVVVSGNHLGLVDVSSESNDTYQLIFKTLSNRKFFNEFTPSEEINILLGHYDAVVRQLYPNRKNLDIRGIKQLVFALEGLQKHDQAMQVIQEHENLNHHGDLLGLMAGRLKREYLETFSAKTAESAIDCYERGLALAESRNDQGQLYYHAINLAFMALLAEDDESKMVQYAQKAKEAAQNDIRNSLWKLATLAEANLYLNELEEAKTLYEKAAKMAGLREKLSIHTNAYKAYVCLMQAHNPEDGFIKFLKYHFLT